MDIQTVLKFNPSDNTLQIDMNDIYAQRTKILEQGQTPYQITLLIPEMRIYGIRVFSEIYLPINEKED